MYSLGVDNFKMCVHTSVHFCKGDYTHFNQKLKPISFIIEYSLYRNTHLTLDPWIGAKKIQACIAFEIMFIHLQI